MSAADEPAVILACNSSRRPRLRMMLLGVVSAVGVFVQTLPPSVLGGVMLIWFGMGFAMDRRNTIILATSLGRGLGVSFVPQITQPLPSSLRSARSSGIAAGGMCALLLNVLLPGERA